MIGIVTAVVAGLTYFATREQVSQLDCMTNYNLILSTYPNQIDQLKLEIELAEMELAKLTPNSYEALRKKTEIDEFVAAKKKKADDFNDAYLAVQRHVCFVKPEGKAAEKKP